jgi:hypothetical protein
MTIRIRFGRPATTPVAAWSGHGAGTGTGTEQAGRGEPRGMPASGGARREGPPRFVTADQVISRQADKASAVTAA